MKKRKLRRGEKIKCLVVGSGENGRRVVKNLEESDFYQPTSIYSSSGKGVMDGIPIVNELKLDGIGAVFIADPLMGSREREEIRKQAEAAGVELHDYTGYFSNLGGRLSLTELMSVVKGPVAVELDGRETVYEDGAAALSRSDGKYEVKSIEGDMKIKIEKAKEIDKGEALKAAYSAVMGE